MTSQTTIDEQARLFNDFQDALNDLISPEGDACIGVYLTLWLLKLDSFCDCCANEANEQSKLTVDVKDFVKMSTRHQGSQGATSSIHELMKRCLE